MFPHQKDVKTHKLNSMETSLINHINIISKLLINFSNYTYKTKTYLVKLIFTSNHYLKEKEILRIRLNYF